MLAHTGNFLEVFVVLDAAGAETRPMDEAMLLAELLVTRAELRLDSGSVAGVESDLFDALKFYRQFGGLRAETNAYLQYVRLLRASGRLDEARVMLAEAMARLARF